MRPLLLLPGMLCDAAFWRAQMESLADICAPRVIAFGLLDDFGAMARKVLAEAPERFALAGHSMGGRVAQEVARLAPGRVAALALLATDYRGHAGETARAAEAARRDAMLATVEADGPQAFARSWVGQVVAAENRTDAALVTNVIDMMVRQPAGALAAQTLAGLNRADQGVELAQIACPTLIGAGEHDTLRPVAVHQEMAARVPNARLAIISGSGHMVAMERPAAVTAAMRAWLGEP